MHVSQAAPVYNFLSPDAVPQGSEPASQVGDGQPSVSLAAGDGVVSADVVVPTDEVVPSVVVVGVFVLSSVFVLPVVVVGLFVFAPCSAEDGD